MISRWNKIKLYFGFMILRQYCECGYWMRKDEWTENGCWAIKIARCANCGLVWESINKIGMY